MLRAVVPLVFLLVLQLCGSDGQLFYQTVREGDDATFSCENVLPDQNQCQFTNWSVGSYPEYTALFINGKKNTAVSSSVSLLQNCSMVLHGVTKEQAGEYFTCQQSENDDGITEMMLFVASLSQEQNDDRATLNCSVTPEPCSHDVKWLNNDEEVKEDHEELRTSRVPFGCWVSVSFKDPSPPSPFYQTLRCEVKQRFPDQISTLFPRAPDIKTTTTAETVGSSEATPSTGTGSHQSEATSGVGHLIRNVVIAGLVTLLLSVAAVFLYTRVKGRGASERSHANVTRGGAVVDDNVAEPSVSAV